jgi:hypothetical protein
MCIPRRTFPAKERSLTLLTLALGAASLCWANPIRYTFTTTGSGTIGAKHFTNALATVTGIGNTSTITMAHTPPFAPNTFDILPTLFGITIAGVGTATFTGKGYFGGHGYIFDNQTDAVAGFGIESDDDFVSNSLFTTYALATSIGPLAGSDMFFRGEATSLGLLKFMPTASGTFTAVVEPAGASEPSSVFLLLAGLGLLMTRRPRTASPSD